MFYLWLIGDLRSNENILFPAQLDQIDLRYICSAEVVTRIRQLYVLCRGIERPFFAEMDPAFGLHDPHTNRIDSNSQNISMSRKTTLLIFCN
jgi:hypothetical protein